MRARHCYIHALLEIGIGFVEVFHGVYLLILGPSVYNRKGQYRWFDPLNWLVGRMIGWQAYFLFLAQNLKEKP